MPKSILIFSDGTRQAGGLQFDENRSNIYKLYRATRVGPDSSIEPNKQVAFYDPGLGSQADTGHIWAKGIVRWIYNLVSQATGFGITANIIDCYAAIIRLYEDGDRIFLFGFSRGAYTVRCLAGVLAKCGVPRHLPNQQPLRLDASSAHQLASYAVKHIYQFTESRSLETSNAYQKFLLETRLKIAARFRAEHGSADLNDPKTSNVSPYFIGVFDTVAALGSWKKSGLFLTGFVVAALAVSAVLSSLKYAISGPLVQALTFWSVFWFIIGAAVLATVFVFLYTHVKFDFDVPDYSFLQKLQTLHLTSTWQTFYDRSLDPKVRYAKHAISIDEDRSDFQRVEWGKFDPDRTPRDEVGNPWFEQVWFPGCHSDVGGSYPENEARLSDGALKWMLATATNIPNPIVIDRSVLQLHPDPTGVQHDERKAGLGLLTKLLHITWGKRTRVLDIPKGKKWSEAPMHKSVYARFNAGPVRQYDRKIPYRPETLRTHIDFHAAYETNALDTKENAAKAIDTEFLVARNQLKEGGAGDA